jgi:hypothetical protein
MRPGMFILVACIGCAGSPSDRPADWSYVHAAVIAPNCATSSCHSERAAIAGVVLDDPDRAYRVLLDRQYVIPADPASTLLQLLEGDERTRMPPDAPLPAADIELVRAWIEQGALR